MGSNKKQRWVKPIMQSLKLKNSESKTEQIPPIIEGRKNPGAYTVSS